MKRFEHYTTYLAVACMKNVIRLNVLIHVAQKGNRLHLQ